MKSLENNKTAIVAIIIFGLAILVYNFLLKSDQNIALDGVNAQDAGRDLVELNRSLQAVTLDQTLFTSTAYKSFNDWSPVLAKDPPKGRNNPFSPIGQ